VKIMYYVNQVESLKKQFKLIFAWGGI